MNRNQYLIGLYNISQFATVVSGIGSIIDVNWENIPIFEETFFILNVLDNDDSKVGEFSMTGAELLLLRINDSEDIMVSM